MADSSLAVRPRPVPMGMTGHLFARRLGWSAQQLLDSFRPATHEDLPALLAFRQRRDWDDANHLRWRYGLHGEIRPCPGQLWVLRTDEKVLAVIGRESQPIHHAGRRHDGQVLMDIQLLPELEGAGGGVWMMQAMFARADATLAVGANPHSIGLVKRLFTPLPQRTYCVLPLDSAAMLRRKGVPGLLAGAGAAVLDAGWSLTHRHAQRRTGAGLDLAETGDIASEWLEELRMALPPETACVLPTAMHLRWRLFDNPRARYRLLVARRNGACVGYAAFRDMADDNAAGHSGMHVLDWKVAAQSAPATLAALFQAIIALARAGRCSKVFATVLDAQAMPVLKKLGFLSKTSSMLATGLKSSLPLPGIGAGGQWQISDLSFDGDGGY